MRVRLTMCNSVPNFAPPNSARRRPLSRSADDGSVVLPAVLALVETRKANEYWGLRQWRELEPQHDAIGRVRRAGRQLLGESNLRGRLGAVDLHLLDERFATGERRHRSVGKDDLPIFRLHPHDFIGRVQRALVIQFKDHAG